VAALRETSIASLTALNGHPSTPSIVLAFLANPTEMAISVAPSYFTFLTKCQNPKACTILLRGPSKDILHEIDRNLASTPSIVLAFLANPTEMAISVAPPPGANRGSNTT
jgi:chaperonin GroEL (HSP60 family)